MSRRTGRLLSATLAAGLVLSMGGAALAAPVGGLKQFKVPTARSEPRAITNGSDGNRWFTEGTSFTGQPPKIARITAAGAITEFLADDVNNFNDGCEGCILTDIAQGPGGILYITSNNASLLRFNVNTLSFEAPVEMPNSNALGGNLTVNATDVWITDFNNDSLWRYNITGGQFTQFPVVEPDDVVVDGAGDVWFTAADDGSVNKLNPTTGAVTRFPAPDGLSPRDIAIATDGQIWFTSRFTPQGVGRLNPATGVFTTFPRTDTGPSGIAASPDGTVWFTQETAGNIARIDNAGLITEGKTVKGSGPFGIVVAPNGDPWYTMMAANKIAALQLR